MDLPILVFSLLILAALTVLHLAACSRAYWRGYNTRRSEEIGPAGRDTNGLASLSAGGGGEYATGYRHGYDLGFRKAQAEIELSAAKHYQVGYNQALADIADEMQAAEREVAAGLTTDLRIAGAN